MPTSERPGDRGRRRANEARGRLGREIRQARISAGLSLRVTASSSRVEFSRISRFERGLEDLRISDIGAVAAVVGLELSVRTYPAGDPIRDVAHARLLERFRRELHPALRWHTEVPFPGRSDLRAWDAVTGRDGWRVGVEAETVIADTQALDRKLALKKRDGAVDHLILLVADTPRNRRALAASPASFGGLPLRSRQVLAALRAGDEPAGSGIVLI